MGHQWQVFIPSIASTVIPLIVRGPGSPGRFRGNTVQVSVEMAERHYLLCGSAILHPLMCWTGDTGGSCGRPSAMDGVSSTCRTERQLRRVSCHTVPGVTARSVDPGLRPRSPGYL